MQIEFLNKIQQPLCNGWDLGSSIGGALIGAAGQAITNAQNQKYQRELMGLQHDYNERSAENAYQRQRELNAENWKLYNSYEAQRASMEAAGLSPALMYGGSGTSGSGAGNTAAQGAGVGLPMANLGNVGAAAIQGAQLGLMNAQVKDLNAKANATNAKLPVEIRAANATAAMNETIAEINKQKFDFIESNWNDIKGYLAATTGKIWQEFQRQVMENNLYQDMKDKGLNPFITNIANQIADRNLKVAQALLEKKKIKLTEEQTRKVKKEIEEVTQHITLMTAQGKLLDKQREYLSKYFTKDTVLGSLGKVAEIIDAIIPF